MKECVYRKLSEEDKKGLRDRSNSATLMLTFGLKQDFSTGICRLLTSMDMGPVGCKRPFCNEIDCPDIEEYRSK